MAKFNVIMTVRLDLDTIDEQQAQELVDELSFDQILEMSDTEINVEVERV